MLLGAAPGTRAFDFYGCPDGRHRIHHIAYAVDDPEREGAHLRSSGFDPQVVMRDEGGIPWYSYFRSPESEFHVELIWRGKPA